MIVCFVFSLRFGTERPDEIGFDAWQIETPVLHLVVYVESYPGMDWSSFRLSPDQ
jgi:hypothetical protein